MNRPEKIPELSRDTRFEGNSYTCIQVTAGSVALDHSVFLTTTRQYLSLDQASFLVSDCYFPSSAPGEYFELVHGSGGVKAGGRGVFPRNFFGAVTGYNDVIDFSGQAVSALSRLYRTAQLPTLIVWGAQDPFIPVSHAVAAHKAIPRSRLEIFDGVGH